MRNPQSSVNDYLQGAISHDHPPDKRHLAWSCSSSAIHPPHHVIFLLCITSNMTISPPESRVNRLVLKVSEDSYEMVVNYIYQLCASDMVIPHK